MQDIPLLYWIFWGMTLLICVQQFIYNYRNSYYFLGLPIILIAGFSFFYVFQSYYVATQLSYLLEPWMLSLGQFVALMALISLLWGWYKGIEKTSRMSIDGRLSTQNVYLEEKSSGLWFSGIFLILVAIVAQTTFSNALSTGTTDWDSASAYWHMLPYVAYPGFLLCVQVLANDKKYKNNFLNYLILVSLSYLHLLPYIINARRGPIFPFVIVILYGFFLSSPNLHKVNKNFILICILLTGLTMLAFVSIRDYSSYGASWERSHLEERLNFETVVIGQATKDGDNEFLYNCAMVSTNLTLDMYQYGTGYLTLLTHWIPRQLWPGKPSLGQGFFYGNITEYVSTVTGWAMSGGASGGGIADAFNQFGLLSPVFWFLLGRYIGIIYSQGLLQGSLSRKGYVVSILSCLHWLIAQGFAASFVPLLIFLGSLKLVYSLNGVDRLPKSGFRKDL